MPYRRSVVLTWVLMWTNLYVYTNTGTPLFDTVHLLYLTSLYQGLILLYFSYHMLIELSGILNVRFFHIKYDAEKAKEQAS